MRRLLTMLFTCIFLVITSTACADNIAPYTIYFQSPEVIQWKLVSEKQDKKGFIRSYFPADESNHRDQNVMLHYVKNEKTSLRYSMKNILHTLIDVDGCQQSTTKIIKQQKHAIIFSAKLTECKHSQSLLEIVKVFNMSDGQYSIAYKANSKTVASAIIQAMKAVIESAEIIAVE